MLNGFSSKRRAGNDASERGDSPASLSRRHTTTLTRSDTINEPFSTLVFAILFFQWLVHLAYILISFPNQMINSLKFYDTQLWPYPIDYFF